MKNLTPFIFIIVILAIALLPAGAGAAPTTEVTISKIAPNGTVVAEITVDYQWMEENLPVQGDGVTHYYHQGPVFSDDKEAQWDKNETTNFKDHGAVKGTDIEDLVELVGGMSPGDDVMIRAADGYHVEFPYANAYEPEPRQGPMVLCWYNGEDSDEGERQGTGYPPDFYTGMRLVFFADTSVNAGGLHVFGNWDMHETFPAEHLHLYSGLYPSTNGYTIKWVDEVRVYEGGYDGETTIAETAVTTTAQSPLPVCVAISALAAGLILFGRSGRRP